jgi:hypothetical protein
VQDPDFPDKQTTCRQGPALCRHSFESILSDVKSDLPIRQLLGTIALLMNLSGVRRRDCGSFAYHDPRTLRNRRAVEREARRERSWIEAKEAREGVRRQRELEDDEWTRREELQRRQLEDERRHREQELDLLAKRHEADMHARAAEVQLRREQVARRCGPPRARRERAEAIAELDRQVQRARDELSASSSACGRSRMSGARSETIRRPRSGP